MATAKKCKKPKEVAEGEIDGDPGLKLAKLAGLQYNSHNQYPTST